MSLSRTIIHARRAGFTLIELIFVLAIICIALGVMAPEFSNFISGQSTANASNKLVALARHGRALAISEGRTYRLNVDTSSGAFWLDAQVGAEFKELGTSNGQHFQIPEGTKTRWVADPNAIVAPASAASAATGGTPVQSGSPAQTGALGTGSQAGGIGGPQAPAAQFVQFFSDGRCDTMTLRLTGKNGTEIELGAPSESEIWRVNKDVQP